VGQGSAPKPSRGDVRFQHHCPAGQVAGHPSANAQRPHASFWVHLGHTNVPPIPSCSSIFSPDPARCNAPPASTNNQHPPPFTFSSFLQPSTSTPSTNNLPPPSASTSSWTVIQSPLTLQTSSPTCSNALNQEKKKKKPPPPPASAEPPSEDRIRSPQTPRSSNISRSSQQHHFTLVPIRTAPSCTRTIIISRSFQNEALKPRAASLPGCEAPAPSQVCFTCAGDTVSATRSQHCAHRDELVIHGVERILAGWHHFQGQKEWGPNRSVH